VRDGGCGYEVLSRSIHAAGGFRRTITVSKVIWHITMSPDGFIAGPGDSTDRVAGGWSDDGTATRDIEVVCVQIARLWRARGLACLRIMPCEHFP
jgi:hypothetical protein